MHHATATALQPVNDQVSLRQPSQPVRTSLHAKLAGAIAQQVSRALARHRERSTLRMAAELSNHLRRDIGLPTRDTRPCTPAWRF